MIQFIYGTKVIYLNLLVTSKYNMYNDFITLLELIIIVYKL